MANDTELLAALKAAHDAGDEQAAMQIAQQLSSMPVTPEVKPVEQPGGNTSGSAPPAGPKYDPSEGGSTLWFGPFDTGIRTSQGVDRFLSGAGQSFAETGRGIKQLFGGQTQEDTDEQRRLDAPLEHTGAGIAGNVAGGVAQFAVPGMGGEALGAKIATKLGTNPGALQAANAIYRITKPAAVGAGFGATSPVGTGETRAGNAGMGALAGEAGQILGNAGSSVLRAGEDALSKGARMGADIAAKYKIPLSMPQTSGGFMGWLGSTLDKMPFSGAQERAEAQRGAFNNALGREAGIPNADGAINTDMTDHAQDTVGGAIGNLAANHTAQATHSNLTDILNVVADARANATPEVTAKVEAKARQMLTHMDPNGQIPGDAWRQANTALGRQIRSETDGDVKHYYGELQEPFMDMMQQGMPTPVQDAFRGLRTQYRNLKTIQPLAEKAGNVGINPNLLQGRNIAAKNNRGNMQELGNLGKEQLTSKYADSGTAQRAMIYAALAGGAGALGNELLGGGEERQHENSGIGALAPMGAMVLGGLGSRVLHSRPLALYNQARLPPELAKYVNGAAGLMPAAAASANADSAEPHMADGGQPPQEPYQKSTFWQLVQQAWKEMSEPSASPPASPPNDGTTPSGTKGADFDHWVQSGVQSSGG
jgi:hypothetical protein